MSALQKGLLLAVIQLSIVASIGGKLAWERLHEPRIWVKAAFFDPDLPIRGRYLSLNLEMKLDPSAQPLQTLQNNYVPNQFYGTLAVKDGQLIVTPSNTYDGLMFTSSKWQGQDRITLRNPVLFFLPEHANNPLTQARGGELWVEVTVPKNGAPRPIRLAVKHGDTFTPLEIK
jgi:hypothetical protein